jgi:hypothetical protein
MVARMRWARDLPLGVVALCAIAVGAPARASLVQAMSLAELTATADRIIVGDVLSVQTAWDPTHRNIISTVEIGVQENWKGAQPPDGKVVIRQLGGTVGEIEMTVVGMPRFVAGERSLLFLHGGLVVGMGQGKRLLRWESTSKTWFAEAQDVSGVVVRTASGTSRPAEGNRREPLSHLYAKVQALLGR